MECIHYELKYCEGCGTLKLRPINFVTDHCVICERMLARFRFPRKAWARRHAGFPVAPAPQQNAASPMPSGRTA